MKIFKKSLIIIFVSITLCSCVNKEPSYTPDNSIDGAVNTPEKVVTVGNLPGSFGRVAASNEGTYFYTDPYKGIMEITEDGELTVLTSDKTNTIYVSNGWIYYHTIQDSPIMEENSGTIYRLNTKSKEKTVFMEFDTSDDYLSLLELINDRIYFRNKEGISGANLVNKTIEPVVTDDSTLILGAKDEYLSL
jgi:hypothetical protein